MYLDDYDPAKGLIIDVECISWDDNQKALQWYNGHEISGFAIGQYGAPSIYLPIRHRYEECLPKEEVLSEIRSFVAAMPLYINFNIKFDMHFMARDEIFFNENCDLVDIMILARLYDCNQESLSLDALCNKYNKVHKKKGDIIHDWCKANNTVDYGAVPLALMSQYAIADVEATKELGKELMNRMQAEKYDMRVWETEKKLNRILFEAEEEGVEIDREFLTLESIKRIQVQYKCINRLKEICGPDFEPGSAKQTRNYFHANNIHSTYLTDLGQTRQKEQLPIGPEHESFGKDMLREIINHIDEEEEIVDDEKVAAANTPRAAAYWLLKYNKESSNYNTYCTGWLEKLSRNNRLHGGFKIPGTRTGRLSMGAPTLHNYPKWAAKALKIPDGEIGIEWDYSQIEYRIFSHYAGQQWLYDAYEADPLLDFHQLMADNTGIIRAGSKTLNFAILYGIGVAKLIRYLTGFILDNDSPMLREKLLAFDPDFPQTGTLEQETLEGVSKSIRARFLRENPGIGVLQSKIREGLGKRSTGARLGYFNNFFNRRYHIEYKKLYRALNYLCQGTAADFFKETMVMIFTKIREQGMSGRNMMTNIHDSVKARMPLSQGQYYWDVSKEIAERDIFRVPIRIDGEMCLGNWGNSFPIINDNIEITYQVFSNLDYYINHYKDRITELQNEDAKLSTKKALHKVVLEEL